MVLLLVASCGGRGGPPPSSNMLDDACAVLRSKPEYKRAFLSAQRRWGVPVHVQMATIHQESKFVSDARTPFRYVLGVIPMGRQSSAFGYSQALDGTWDEYRQETGKRGARRDNIRDSTDFMGWYMTGTKERLKIPLSDARNQYLAYHEGRTGYSRGTYMSKPWLLRVSAKVEDRSQMYRGQLTRCGVK